MAKQFQGFFDFTKQEILANAPSTEGVYILYNNSKAPPEIVYVNKTTDIKASLLNDKSNGQMTSANCFKFIELSSEKHREHFKWYVEENYKNRNDRKLEYQDDSNLSDEQQKKFEEFIEEVLKELGINSEEFIKQTLGCCISLKKS